MKHVIIDKDGKLEEVDVDELVANINLKLKKEKNTMGVQMTHSQLLNEIYAPIWNLESGHYFTHFKSSFSPREVEINIYKALTTISIDYKIDSDFEIPIENLPKPMLLDLYVNRIKILKSLKIHS